jgi:protein-S-isoprenylcysteine O-methyltransferase Ste14
MAIPAAALTIYAVFGLLAGAGRALLQYRRTGDFGLRFALAGHSRAAYVVPFFIAMAGIAAPLSGVADLLGWRIGRHLFDSVLMNVTGLALMAAGGVLMLVAQLEMGASWRAGIDPAETTALVTTGVFKLIRHPIYTGALISLAGLTLAVPNALAIAGLTAAFVGIEILVRLIEEPHLLRVHGDRYADYAHAAGRFVPALGTK